MKAGPISTWQSAAATAVAADSTVDDNGRGVGFRIWKRSRPTCGHVFRSRILEGMFGAELQRLCLFQSTWDAAV